MFNTKTKLSKEEMNDRMKNTKLTPQEVEEEKELVHDINLLAKLIQSSKLQFCVSLAKLFAWVDRVYGYGMREKYWNHHYLNGTFNLQYNTARRYAAIGKNEKLILERSKGRIDIKDTYDCLRRLMEENRAEEDITDEILKLVEKNKTKKKENKDNDDPTKRPVPADNTNTTNPTSNVKNDNTNTTNPTSNVKNDNINTTYPSSNVKNDMGPKPTNNLIAPQRSTGMDHDTHVVDVKVSGNHIVPIPKISEPDDSDYEMVEDTGPNAKLLEENKMLKETIKQLQYTIKQLQWTVLLREKKIEELRLILALKTGTHISDW